MNRWLIGLIVMGILLGGGVVWSQSSPQWQQVGVLEADVSRGETLLLVEWIGNGTVGTAVLIESRDEGLTEVGAVSDIHGRHLVLKGRTQNHFKAGSRVYQ